VQSRPPPKARWQVVVVLRQRSEHVVPPLPILQPSYGINFLPLQKQPTFLGAPLLRPVTGLGTSAAVPVDDGHRGAASLGVRCVPC
jgi:hypothetical protein